MAQKVVKNKQNTKNNTEVVTKTVEIKPKTTKKVVKKKKNSNFFSKALNFLGF